MKKKSLLLIIPLIIIIIIVILVVHKNDKVSNIDITDTGFEYDVIICDEYFELVECIINKDTDENYTKQMRIDLKNEVKQMQEEWKSFGREELTKKCTEELAKFENDEMKNKLKSFGCSLK